MKDLNHSLLSELKDKFFKGFETKYGLSKERVCNLEYIGKVSYNRKSEYVEPKAQEMLKKNIRLLEEKYKREVILERSYECPCGQKTPSNNGFLCDKPTGQIFSVGVCCVDKFLNTNQHCERCNAIHRTRNELNLCSNCFKRNKTIKNIKKKNIYDHTKNEDDNLHIFEYRKKYKNKLNFILHRKLDFSRYQGFTIWQIKNRNDIDFLNWLKTHQDGYMKKKSRFEFKKNTEFLLNNKKEIDYIVKYSNYDKDRMKYEIL